MDEDLTIDPINQYQVGDVVIYTPEGVVAQISGFYWGKEVKGKPPRIEKYNLTCNLCVEGKYLKRYNNELETRRMKQ